MTSRMDSGRSCRDMRTFNALLAARKAHERSLGSPLPRSLSCLIRLHDLAESILEKMKRANLKGQSFPDAKSYTAQLFELVCVLCMENMSAMEIRRRLARCRRSTFHLSTENVADMEMALRHLAEWFESFSSLTAFQGSPRSSSLNMQWFST